MFIHNLKFKLVRQIQLFLGLIICNLLLTASAELTLEKTITLAQKNDLWLVGNQHSENAIQSLSIEAGTLPDPKISIDMANLATDSFDFNQEPMSQIKIGISQQFPRGNSRELKQKQLKLQSMKFPYQRQNRKAKIAVTIAKLWLDAYKAQESIELIEANRILFEQLADVVQARYASVVGKTRQQDIILAQLELTRIEDRLSLLGQQQEVSQQQLYQWISAYFLQQSKTENSVLINAVRNRYKLARKLPKLSLKYPQIIYGNNPDSEQETLLQYFSKHPAVSAIEQQIKATNTGVDLAKQKYQTQWAMNASYGYRDHDPLGADRADFLSIGVTFDVPLFTDNRQDQSVKSAISKTQAMKTEKWLMLRKLFTAFEASRAELLRIEQRQQLYQKRLLPQIREQAEASLSAYTNDDGDFSEVVRARIAVLNAEIDSLGITVERQKSIAQLNYFFESTNQKNIALSTQGEK